MIPTNHNIYTDAKLFKSLLLLIYSIVWWVSFVLLFVIFLYFIVLWYFKISAVWNLNLEQYSVWVNDTWNKQKTALIYTPQKKITFSICFVHKYKKNITLGVDLWSQKVMWQMFDLCKLCVKISIWLYRKSSGSSAAESVVVKTSRVKFVEGALEPPPPPHAIRVN